MVVRCRAFNKGLGEALSLLPALFHAVAPLRSRECRQVHQCLEGPVASDEGHLGPVVPDLLAVLCECDSPAQLQLDVVQLVLGGERREEWCPAAFRLCEADLVDLGPQRPHPSFAKLLLGETWPLDRVIDEDVAAIVERERGEELEDGTNVRPAPLCGGAESERSHAGRERSGARTERGTIVEADRQVRSYDRIDRGPVCGGRWNLRGVSGPARNFRSTRRIDEQAPRARVSRYVSSKVEERFSGGRRLLKQGRPEGAAGNAQVRKVMSRRLEKRRRCEKTSYNASETAERSRQLRGNTTGCVSRV
ncbi:hypothetical protein BJY59DRAFT_699361 [Rhodotorula toruloides]